MRCAAVVACLMFWAVRADDDIVWLTLANVEIVVTMIFVIALRVLGGIVVVVVVVVAVVAALTIDYCYGRKMNGMNE